MGPGLIQNFFFPIRNHTLALRCSLPNEDFDDDDDDNDDDDDDDNDENDNDEQFLENV